MRVLLAISVIYHVTTAQKIGINVPCNKELDGLLTADPDGDDRAFMSCQSVGVGNIGFWERKLCPNNMIFDFINQQCKDISKKARKPQQLNIAILNNSCAKGETCIGGSVCDLDSLKCMCPYGTIPKLDTLSCESNEPPFVSATVDGPSQFFNSLSGPNRNNGGFFPFSSNTNSPDFSPNTNGFKFNNFENQNSNNNENNNFKWNPNFSWQNGNSYNNNNNGGSGVGGANQQPINNMNGPSPSDISNSFQPNPSQAQKFVFNFNKNTLSGVSNNNNNNNPIPEIKPKITTLAPPGASCKSNEICIGGSICTLPIGICLCPGDLEARDGECVLPAASTIAVSKVGIGALCSDLAECDHGSICVMGRCTCVSPLIQHEGKCVLRQQQKVVGPGELCDNGEICGKGSVCDVMIPVCVCPSHTDLSMGECVQVTATVTHSVMTPPPTLPPVQTAPPPTRPQQVVPTLIQTPPVKQPEVVTYSPKTSATIHSFYTSPPSTQYVPKHIYTAPPQLKPSVKVNQMKIGGSKQAGVGVRCSLNTDCMIGAYCNGNTNPPSCQCLSTHVNIEGRCEKVIYPGQVGCRSDLQCHAAYTGTHCIDRICMCPEGQKAVDQTCVSASEPVTSPPGGSCSNLRECTGGSVCREGWCICPDSSMIVNKGICIQSGSKPTLPPKTIAPQINSASNTNMNAPRVTMPKSQTFVTEGPHGKKIAPGGNCGPLDSCVGNSNCIEGYCLCPVGQQPGSNGRCEKMTTTTRLTTKTTKTPASTAKVYSKPGENCAVEQICVGGSQCSVRNICECPQEKPELLNGQCSSPKKVEVVPGASCNQNSICIRGSSCESGLCRCQPGFIAVSGNCVALPMPTTPKMKTIAKPLESCENGETCNGGSSCDDDTGICMCPPGEIVFNVQCMLPPTQAPTTKKMESLSTKSTSRSPFRTDCEKDSNCAENKICVSGKCKCKPGFVDNSGRCEPLEGKRTRMLKYGQACDRYQDKCTNGAKCIDNVCKCGTGFLLSSSGWCEGFVLEKAIENNKKIMKTTTMSSSKAIALTESKKVFSSQVTQEPEPFPTPPSSIFGFTKKSSTKRVPKVAAVGSSCEPIDVCLNSSICQSGYCQCPKNFILQNGQCISRKTKHKVAKVGGTCKNGEICSGGSICDSDQKKCICAAQHIAIKGICKLKSAPSFAAPGSTCSMGEKCTGGSSCVHGMCSCDEKHFAEDGYCRPIEVRSSPIQFINGAGLRFSSKAVPPRSRAQPCNENECKLPNCFCSSDGRQIPGGLKLDETPQFVVLTFDDAVNGKTFPDYKELFENDILKNPNGCDVKATFFISHEWTNYDAVGWLVQKKMEIASNSISHVSLEHESTNRWLNEMDGQRRILAKFGGVPEEEIYGIRAPQLALGGDRQFEMMAGANFLYDNSMSANPGVHGDPFWPQTLDYQVAWSCYEDSCPKSSFPGIWSVPLNQFYGAYMRQIDSFKRSSMIRAAVDLNNTVDELESIIMRNFERSYSSNRAPFVLSLNADFLQLNGKKNGMKALKKFLNRMRVQKDVYMVTIKQLIDWMKRPVPLSQMHKSKAVGCPVTMAFHQNPTAQTTCLKPNKCLYNTPSLSSQEHQFLTCLPCPTMYPWLENPSGAIV